MTVPIHNAYRRLTTSHLTQSGKALRFVSELSKLTCPLNITQRILDILNGEENEASMQTYVGGYMDSLTSTYEHELVKS